MTCYILNGQRIDLADVGVQELLANAHMSSQRPICICKDPGAEMYIAKINNSFIVKRMPNTAEQHHPGCESYEPPIELSGIGELAGAAIREDAESGVMALRLGFSLNKRGKNTQEKPAVDSAGQDTATSVKTDGNKLTLKSTLHLLWEQAGFNRHQPGVSAKRTWSFIRYQLTLAVQKMVSRAGGLAEILYIPEVFRLDHKDEINHRRLAQMMKFNAAERESKKLMLFVGEVKSFSSGRFGFKVTMKHLPDCPFNMPADLYQRLKKKFHVECDLWDSFDDTHLIMIGTASVNTAGMPTFEEVAVMNVNSEWVPFESVYDYQLLQKLISDSRSFMKGLRYNLPIDKPIANVVLSDVGDRPYALYLLPEAATEEYRNELSALITDSSVESLIWDMRESMPSLPLPTTATIPQHTHSKHI